jgi:hypothetical protein
LGASTVAFQRYGRCVFILPCRCKQHATVAELRE